MANDATSKTVAFEPQRREDGSAAEVQEALLRGSESSECLEPRNTLLFPGLYPVVCCSLKQTSFPRLWCLKMVSNPTWFERVSMLVILLNCVTLGLYQPCENIGHPCDSERCNILAAFDHFVFAFFAVEMVIKMVAMGVWGKLGYLGEAWNRLDFFIVLCGLLEYMLPMEGMVNFTSVRTVRVLRPLRAINRVPSMRILVMLLLDTLPMLGNVLMLCSFVFFIFGVVAVQLWAGTLRQRCFLDAEVFNFSSAPNHTVSYDNTSLPLPPYFNYDVTGENAQICTLPTYSGDFQCSDRALVPPSKVGNVTCSLNATYYDASSPLDKLYIADGQTDCIDWNGYYSTCQAGDTNPFQGAISFDNIMYAWVAIFQVISLEGWVDIMYFVMDGYSFYSFIYFILLIVIGSFFMINLCLVVIATQFSVTKQREQRLMEEQRLRFKSNDSTLASYSPPGNCYEEMLKYISHLCRKSKRRINRRLVKWKKEREEKQEVAAKSGKPKSATKQSKPKGKRTPIHLHHHYHHHHHHFHIESASSADTALQNVDGHEKVLTVGVEIDLHNAPHFVEPGGSPHAARRLMLTDSQADRLEIPTIKNAMCLSLPARSSASLRSSSHSLPTSVTPEPRRCYLAGQTGPNEVSMAKATAYYERGFKPRSTFGSQFGSSNQDFFDFRQTPSESYYFKPASPTTHRTYVTSDLNYSCSAYDVRDVESTAEKAVCDETDEEPVKCCSRFKNWIKAGPGKLSSSWSTLTKCMKRIVDSKYFGRGIMIAILINTLSMGIEHYKQPKTLTDILETSNVVFTTLFVLEMISKLLAYGLIGYIKNFYNVFDAAIVIISVWEIACTPEGGSGGLSVLRTFRLLRVLKLVRFLPALRRQLLVLMRTMDNVATFMMLLTLFIFIFSILGMHLFGCKFCFVNQYGERECDRKNFDSLLWAFVTVFQILTQEDWNVVLYNGMDATTPFAAIYFITLMTIGNYVLFNLLVAILVEGFQAECYPECFGRPGVNDDFNDHKKAKRPHKLAEKYTEQVAGVLGLRRPSEVKMEGNRHVKGVHPLVQSLGANLRYVLQRGDSEESAPSITSTDDELSPDDGLIFEEIVNSNVQENRHDHVAGEEASSHVEVPIITCTAATPTPNAPRSLFGGSTEDVLAVCETEARCRDTIEAASARISATASETNLSSSVSSGSRKSSIASRLSACSSPRKLSGSFLLRPKSLPIERQSLVSSLEDEDCSSDEDIYSNHSFDISDEASNDVKSKTSTAFNEVTEGFAREATNSRDCLRTSSSPPTPSVSRKPQTCHHDHPITQGLCNCLSAAPPGCAIRRVQRFIRRRSEWSLYIFSPEGRFRKRVQKVVSNKWFDYIILFFIFGNCITIAMERPSLDDESSERLILDVFNYIFTVVFTIELIAKVIATGLGVGKSAYLKSGWNVLDFVLVLTSLVDIIMTLASGGGSKLFGILRVLRLLRTLRPLRVISRAPGLKVVVQTLLSSLKPIGNIVLICCAFFMIFGILGVQLLKGKFYYCDGPEVHNVTNRTNCLQANRENRWVNQRYNFDDLGQALMSLFVLASKDGWVEIMYHGLDAVGEEQQPQQNYNPWMLIYFISFLLIVGFFVINMFVGVVVENFHRCREQHELEEQERRQQRRARKQERHRQKQLRKSRETGSASTLRRQALVRARSHVAGVRGILQDAWKRIKSVCCGSSGKEDDNLYFERYGPVRKAIHLFCMNKYFELGVSAVIGVNILTMAVEHYHQPKVLDQVLRYANYFFTAVFILEAMLKLIALGVRRYFRDRWNQLDMFIVILSIVGITIEYIEDMESAGNRTLIINPTIIRVMRVLRIARVLKLLKVSQGIRSLLETIACALPQVGNLGMLFALLFFIFAALGVELFGTLTCDDEHSCDGLGRHASFSGFGIALLTLFRISTGDNWNGIMKDTLRENCDASAECKVNCCVSTIITPIYFVLFVTMAQFVLVNVVVAVLMKHLEDKRAEEMENEEDDEDDFKDDDDENESDLENDGRDSNVSSEGDSSGEQIEQTDETQPLLEITAPLDEANNNAKEEPFKQMLNVRKTSTISTASAPAGACHDHNGGAQVACSITSDFRSSAPMLTGSLRSSSELLSSGANSQFSKPTALLDLPLDPSRLSKSLELGPSTNVNQQERRFSDYCTLCPQCRQKSLLSSGGFSTNETLPPEGEIVCSDHTLVPDKPIQSTKSPSSLTSLTSENTEKISTPSRFQRKSLPAIIAPDLTEEDLPSLRSASLTTVAQNQCLRVSPV